MSDKYSYYKSILDQNINLYRGRSDYYVQRENIFLDSQIYVCKLYNTELDELNYNSNIILKKIDSYKYNKISSIGAKYYDYDSDSEQYVWNKTEMTNSDFKIYLDNIIFVRRNVVWAELGFNIGVEFGGKHPVIILDKVGEGLIVLPVSSSSYDPANSFEMDIPNIYNFNNRSRYVNIQKMRQISIYRVDLSGSVGNIHKSVYADIKRKIREYWS